MNNSIWFHRKRNEGLRELEEISFKELISVGVLFIGAFCAFILAVILFLSLD